MLLRISLIIAILAGLGAGVVAYLEVTDTIPKLKAQRDQEQTLKKDEIAAHTKTKGNLKQTQADLAQTQSELSDTKGERDKALARAEEQTKRADELSDKLAKATQTLNDTQNQLAAYKATDLTPDQVLKLSRTLKEAQNQIAAINAEKAVLNRSLTSTKAILRKFIGDDTDIKLPADLKGKIIVVDPKWEFVVLDIGTEQGVIQDGELLVSRDGKLVAKVIIRSVQKDRCVANIMPGWKLGEPIEGDIVTPAHPAS